jgi:hypothetical protein
MLSGNLSLLETSGLFRPAMGLLYLLLYINETGCEVVSWIKVTYDRMQYQAPVNNAEL